MVFLYQVEILVVAAGPPRRVPAQNAHLQVGVELLRVGRELKTGITLDVRRFGRQPHRGRIGSSRVIPVVTHLDLDLRHDRIRAAEQDLKQRRVGVWVLRLVVHQHRAGAVGAEHAKSLERQPVHVPGRHVVAVEGDAGRRRGRGHGGASHRTGRAAQTTKATRAIDAPGSFRAARAGRAARTRGAARVARAARTAGCRSSSAAAGPAAVRWGHDRAARSLTPRPAGPRAPGVRSAAGPSRRSPVAPPAAVDRRGSATAGQRHARRQAQSQLRQAPEDRNRQSRHPLHCP